MAKGVSPEGPRLIKRYANRKLYDTRESRYVTLQQIAAFVRDGQDVRIVDNRSKEDLTNVTLAQIIYEEEKSGESGARRSSLLTFIQEGRDRLITSLPKFPFRTGERAEDEAERLDPAEAAELRREMVALRERLDVLEEKLNKRS